MQIPAIIYMERVDTREHLDLRGLFPTSDPTILTRDTSISQLVVRVSYIAIYLTRMVPGIGIKR